MIQKDKLIHQLFIGKVVEIIGFDETIRLLQETNKALENFETNEKTNTSS